MIASTTTLRAHWHRQAELARVNQLDSREWSASILAFDLIRGDLPGEVIVFAEELSREPAIEPWALAALLAIQAQCDGGNA